jgi:hypothetical protein
MSPTVNMNSGPLVALRSTLSCNMRHNLQGIFPKRSCLPVAFSICLALLSVSREARGQLVITRGAAGDVSVVNPIEPLQGAPRHNVGLLEEERNEVAEIAQAKPTIDLEIRFGPDSAVISPLARMQLEALGRALSSPALKDMTIVIAGHTDTVIDSILQSGLCRDQGWLMVWEKPNNPKGLFEKPDLSTDDTRGPRETAPVGICFCGEESSASVYARERNVSHLNDTPILIEVEVDPENVAVDGRDFLYSVFQFGDPQKATPALERLFGPRALRFAQAAWSSADQSKRLALCDLAIHDKEVIAHHYRNRAVIGGRNSTRFFTAFKIKLPLEPASIVRVWRPGSSSNLPPIDIDFVDILLPPDSR